MNRRQFVRKSLAAAPAVGIASHLHGKSEEEPHFLLFITMPQAANSSEFFDARPKSWTTDHPMLSTAYLSQSDVQESTEIRKVLQKNMYFNDLSDDWRKHFDQDVITWTDSKGGSLLGRASTRILKPLQEELTVFNGVHMDPEGDGHDRNLQHLFCVNYRENVHVFDQIKAKQVPFSYIQIGDNGFIPHFKNSGTGMRFGSYGQWVQNLSFIQKNQNFPMDQRVLKNHIDRHERLYSGIENLNFFGGAGKLSNSLGLAPNAFKVLSQIKLQKYSEAGSFEGHKRYEQMIKNFNFQTDSFCELFSRDITRVGISVCDFSYDSHDIGTLVNGAPSFFSMAEIIKYAVNKLKNTPFRDKTLFEYTTLIANSEFSRSMRQRDVSIFNSGNDHNTVAGSIIGAGKSFRKLRGRIIGKTDIQELSDDIGKAHWKFEDEDPRPLKLVGLPFDFNNLSTASPKLDEEYSVERHLHYKNIINSILFGRYGIRNLEKFDSGIEPALISDIVTA